MTTRIGKNIKFKSDKNVEDLSDGIFLSFLKYGALIIVTWLALSLITFFILGNYDLLQYIDNTILESIIVLIVVGFYAYKIYQKFTLGRLFSVQINYVKEKIVIESVNTITGNVIVNKVPFDEFAFSSKVNANSLLGKQRLVSFYNNGNLIAEVNLELTEWGKLEQTPEMFKRLKELNF